MPTSTEGSFQMPTGIPDRDNRYLPDRRSDAPETSARAGSFSYDLAIQPDHDCVIEYTERAVRCNGTGDRFSLINSVFAELQEIEYVGRPGLEFDFSAIGKARAANCFGLASLATSCIIKLLGDKLKCLVILGKRKRDPRNRPARMVSDTLERPARRIRSAVSLFTPDGSFRLLERDGPRRRFRCGRRMGGRAVGVQTIKRLPIVGSHPWMLAPTYS